MAAVESLEIGTKYRKEDVFKIKQLAKSFISDPKNANNIVDIIASLESDSVGIVTASIHAISSIFVHLLTNRSMYLLRPPSENEHLLDRSAEEKYKLWLRGHYQRTTDRLLEFLISDKQKLQDLSLRTVMKFIALEGKRPLQDVSKEKQYFPNHILELVVNTILSDEVDTKNVIASFQEFLDFPDVKFYTLKILKGLMKSAKTKNRPAMYLNNCFCLMKLLTFPSETGDDATGINLCNRDDPDAAAFKFEPKFAKKIFSSMWLNFLKLQLPGPLYRRVLLCLDEKILPCMDSPLLMTDFLMDSYNMGGVTSLLALNGLFVLMLKHNLEFPDFYKNLYSLFEPGIFFTKYRPRFFFLADIFLSSTHLPEYLAAAFAKRLARISLTAPPHCLVLAIYFIQNLLLRHPGLYKLIHDPQNTQDLTTDPYILDESDPAKCRAMESSLWEIKTLQSHYHPKVSQAAKFIDRPLPKAETDLSEYLELTTTEMIEEESKRNNKTKVAITFTRPTGLFGQDDDRMRELWTL